MHDSDELLLDHSENYESKIGAALEQNHSCNFLTSMKNFMEYIILKGFMFILLIASDQVKLVQNRKYLHWLSVISILYLSIWNEGQHYPDVYINFTKHSRFQNEL